MRKVLVFKETLLPPSETFILAQLTSLKHYQFLLAGLEWSHPSLHLTQYPLLLTNGLNAIAPFRAKLYRKTGIAPIFHRKARKFGPNLVHAHFASGGLSAMAVARSLGVPMIVTLHGSDVTVRGAHSTYQQLGQQARLFLCVSNFIRDKALEAGFPDNKLLVHYIGIDREVFSPSTNFEGTRNILFIGRLVEKKGCEYLLRAMQLVQNEHPNSELTIVGDGPLRPDLQALAKELSLSCKFLGVQSSEVVRDLLRSTRIFCAPSVVAANGDSEGLPTVLAEAQAMGLPVVATWHAGIPELVADGFTGLLVPERNVCALAAALSRLLEDEALWHRFHLAAQDRIACYFDLNIQTALLEKIYTRVSTTNSF